jgi:Tfp pilus assembly protein PilE
MSSGKSSQRGFGLLSVALGLALAVALAAGGVQLFGSFYTKATAEQAFKEISMLRQKIERLYANRDNYSGLSEASLVASGVLPESMIDSSSGEIIMTGSRSFLLQTYGSPACRARDPNCAELFTFYLWGMDTGVCKVLAMKEHESEPYAYGVGIPNQTFWPPFDRAAMAAACETTGSDGLTIFRIHGNYNWQ